MSCPLLPITYSEGVAASPNKQKGKCTVGPNDPPDAEEPDHLANCIGTDFGDLSTLCLQRGVSPELL